MKTKYGQSMPGLMKNATDIMVSRLEQGTKESYASCLRHWTNWNLEFDEDPFELPIPPLKIICWIQSRFEERRSIQSLKTWTATLNWICDLTGAPKTYKQDPRYINFKKAINKQFKKGADHRHPFQLSHICNYVKSLWSEDLKHINYENQVKALLAQLYLCTMSRPAELVKPDSKYGQIRGLKLHHYRRFIDKQHHRDLIELTIDLYKNQASKQIKKKIYLFSTKCTTSNNCPCRFINPHRFLRSMLKTRKRLALELKERASSTFSSKQKAKLMANYENLRLKPDNYLFVHTNGKPFTIKDIRLIANDCIAKNQILDSHHYTPYSFRIGGTTRASLAGLDHPLILKYVGWSSSRLADCAQRYMRYSPYQLSLVPFKLIHPQKPITGFGKIYDPWSERLDLKYYNNQ